MIRVGGDLDEDNEIGADVDANDLFACGLPAGERLPTGVP